MGTVLQLPTRTARPREAMGLMLTVSPEWDAVVAAWDEELRAIGRPPSTRYIRTYHVRRFAHETEISPWLVAREDLIRWFAGHEWAPETRRGYRSSMRVFYQWAVDTGRVSLNPAALIPPVRMPRPRPRPAPNDVVRHGMHAADERVRLMVYILALTGLRRGEVARLHADDLERTMDGYRLRVVGKGGHVRVVPVADDLASMIRTRGKGFLFPGQIDGHLSAAHVGKLVARALPDGWTAHTLRHRFATVVYRESRDIRAVQELLGHASVQTTQLYTDVPDSILRVASQAASMGLVA